jgi:DNA-binding MarR family transcriptional regulator
MPPSKIIGARAPEPVADDLSVEDFGLIADRLFHLQHVVTRLRAAQISRAGEDSEWARHRVLFLIARNGPLRLSALADIAQTDASTLSRQVAGLVRSGLIERRADPGDGRASLLVLTAAGRRVHDAQLCDRDDHYRRMMAEWSAADRHEFSRLLGRFVDDLDAYLPNFAEPASSSAAPDRTVDESGETT